MSRVHVTNVNDVKGVRSQVSLYESLPEEARRVLMAASAMPSGGSNAPARYPMSSAGEARYGGGTKSAMHKSGQDVETLIPKNIFPELTNENLDLSILIDIEGAGYPNRGLNGLMRFFDRIHPLFGTCIDFHATSLLGKFRLEGIGTVDEGPTIRHFYEDWVDDIRLYRRLYDVYREYFLLGEVYPYASWNEHEGYFDEITVIDPDSILITDHYLLGEAYNYIAYEPDSELQNLVALAERDPKFSDFLDGLDDVLIEAVKKNTSVRLSNFNIDQIARKSSPYDRRGTPIGMRCLKDIILEERYRQAQYTIAGRHVVPLMVWKLGAQGLPFPTDTDFENFRTMLMELGRRDDPNLITHWAVNGEPMGVTGRTLPLDNEFGRIEDNILTALFLNKAALRGEGPSFSGAPSIALRALNHMYNSTRNIIEEWLRYKLFRPMAVAQDFYVQEKKATGRNRIRIGMRKSCNECEYIQRKTAGKITQCPFIRQGYNARNCLKYVSASKRFLVPTINWIGKLSLLEESDIKRFILDLSSAIGGLPVEILCRYFNLDYQEVKKLKEQEKGSIFDPDAQAEIDEFGGGGGGFSAPMGGEVPSAEFPAETGGRGEADMGETALRRRLASLMNVHIDNKMIDRLLILIANGKQAQGKVFSENTSEYLPDDSYRRALSVIKGVEVVNPKL